MNGLTKIFSLLLLGVFSIGLVHGMVPHIHYSHEYSHSHQHETKDVKSHHHDSSSEHSHENESVPEKNDDGSQTADEYFEFVNNHSHSTHIHLETEFLSQQARNLTKVVKSKISPISSWENNTLLDDDLLVPLRFDFRRIDYLSVHSNCYPLRGPPSLL